MMSQSRKVPRNTPRMTPANSRSCSGFSAAAACCMNTPCNPTAGIPICPMTYKSVVKAPYSSFGIRLAGMWQAYIIAPPSVVASIIQPLCRKKVMWCLGLDMEEGSALAAIMCSGEYHGDLVQGSERKKRKSNSSPFSNAFSEIHSSAVCAWAMSPGPNTTLGIPPSASTAASQKK